MSGSQMLSLRGSAALSPFRLEKILADVKAAAPRITGLYAEFWHFAWVEGALAEAQQETLRKILTYGPRQQPATPEGELFLVIPRPGTISPWSTRATEIARHCGIESMKRLERGRFLWPSPTDGVVTISPAQLGYLLEGIDWRMPQHTWRPQAAG